MAVIIITPFKTVTYPTQSHLFLYSFRSDFESTADLIEPLGMK